MKPRIFISSTFYDLKYIREDLANYIRAHDFEPILFEDGDVGYKPNTELDDSCYRAMENADMAVLIIGGNYGSAASGEKPDDFKEFISVTRNEFKKGVEKGIPFFVFIDRNVYAEYNIYELNCNEIEEGKCTLKFKAAKNLNVFRFIKEIRSIKQLPITEFDKVSDIKDFLGKQWADMFKSYLQSLKEGKKIEQLQDKIASMNIIVEKMDKIIDIIGNEILKDSKEEYKQIIEERALAEIKSAALIISKSFSISVDRQICKKRSTQVKTFLNALKKMYDDYRPIKEKYKNNEEELYFEAMDIAFTRLTEQFKEKGLKLIRLSSDIFENADAVYPLLNEKNKYNELYNMIHSSEYYHRIFSVIKNTVEVQDIDLFESDEELE